MSKVGELYDSLKGMLQSYEILMGDDLPLSANMKEVVRGCFFGEIEKAKKALMGYEMSKEMENASHVAKVHEENIVLRERIERFEWMGEVLRYDIFTEHPMCTSAGNSNRRGQIFWDAVGEYENIVSSATTIMEEK